MLVELARRLHTETNKGEETLKTDPTHKKEQVNSLQARLRTAPDAVMIGETRDPATMLAFFSNAKGGTASETKWMSDPQPSSHEKTIPVLHLHAQRNWHDEAYIVANRAALEKLKSCIEEALQKGQTCGLFYPTDGEGFHLHVLMDNADWQSESWQRRALPYTDEIASATSDTGRDVRYPWNEIVDWECAEDPVG